MTNEENTEYPYQRIAVPKSLYERIVKLAEENGRTIGGQIAWMVKQEEEKASEK